MADLLSLFAGRSLRRRKLPFNAQPGVRIAQISLPQFLFDGAQYFAPSPGSGLESFAPQCLVGTADHLRTLAQAVRHSQLELGQLRYPVFVITESREMPVTETLRRQLWDCLKVPVYEVLLGHDHLPVAYECEGREGWHVAPEVHFRPSPVGELWYQVRKAAPISMGLTGSLSHEACTCGLESARVENLRLEFADPIRSRLRISA
jgi:hypothetical protein